MVSGQLAKEFLKLLRAMKPRHHVLVAAWAMRGGEVIV
jgi:hypothetical protein